MIVEEIGIPTGGAHVAAGRLSLMRLLCKLDVDGKSSCESHIDHFDPDMIAASFEVLQPILLEHGYGADDVAQLNVDCVAEVS
jgi:hypothetical protein